MKPDGDMPGWFRLSDEAGVELVTENGSKATTMIRTENSEPDNWMAEDEEENAG